MWSSHLKFAVALSKAELVTLPDRVPGSLEAGRLPEVTRAERTLSYPSSGALRMSAEETNTHFFQKTNAMSLINDLFSGIE